MSRTFEGLDSSLDVLHHQRDVALADVDAPDRAARLADLFEAEARLWSAYFGRSRSRCLWRAALGAEAWARHNAAQWRARAGEAERSAFARFPRPRCASEGENPFSAAAALDTQVSAPVERAGV